MRANAEKIYKSGKETFLCYCRLGCV